MKIRSLNVSPKALKDEFNEISQTTEPKETENMKEKDTRCRKITWEA